MPIKCVICLSDIYPTDSAASTDCGHVFHSSCLIQWHLQSTTCPQCRAVCDAKNIRHLYFNSIVNNSPAVEEAYFTELTDSILRETVMIKNQLTVQLQLDEATLTYLETLRQLEVSKLHAAIDQIHYLKIEHLRLCNLEHELKENTKKWQGMDDDGTRNFINAAANEVEVLLNETPESLAKMVIMLRGQMINKEMKRYEVLNTLKVCRLENVKLNVNKRKLRERFSSLQTDDNKEN